jgi:hypothetical protein
MKASLMLKRMAGIFGIAASIASVHAAQPGITLAVVMTNDPQANQIQVYDTRTQALMQTLPTQGKGGVGGNARGVRQLNSELVAVVNNGSNSVALFKRHGNTLRFDQVVTTTSAPVSIDFGNDHMYVAGATTVDSFEMNHGGVVWRDGSAPLALAGGGSPPAGSTAQVGVLNKHSLLVTLKTDPTPGTVDIVALQNGAVTGASPNAVSAPAGSLTPFGFAVYPDGTALITLAHSNQDGLFRDGAFTTAAVIAAGQSAPCWATRIGKYVFTANAGSKTISRVVGTGSNIFIDKPVAATLAGGPTDLDADHGVMGVLSKVAGVSQLSLLTYDRFGDLTPSGAAISLGVPNANGVAILAPTDRDD